MDVGNYSYKLSVIVPITKMAGNLGLLKSWVSDAIKKEVKVILVHDFNDAETSDELKKFVSLVDSDAVAFIEGRFGSPGSARNAGMIFVDSEWVAFWDSDDFPEVSKALNLIDKGTSKRKTILVGSFSKVNISEPQAIEQVFFRGSPNSWINQISKSPGLWRFIIHGSRLHKMPFSEIRMGEDQLLIEELLEFSGDFYFCNESIYTYHVGNQFQATRSKTARADIDQLVLQTASLYKKSIKKYRRILAPYLVRQFVSAIKYLEISALLSLTVQLIQITRLWMLLEALLLTLVANRSRSLM